MRSVDSRWEQMETVTVEGRDGARILMVLEAPATALAPISRGSNFEMELTDKIAPSLPINQSNRIWWGIPTLVTLLSKCRRDEC